MNPETHISSIVVHTRPDMADAVARAIEALDCEVVPTEGGHACGRIIAIVERPTDRQVVEALDAFHAIPGVLSALLVYHHAEPVAALGELMK